MATKALRRIGPTCLSIEELVRLCHIRTDVTKSSDLATQTVRPVPA